MTKWKDRRSERKASPYWYWGQNKIGSIWASDHWSDPINNFIHS